MRLSRRRKWTGIDKKNWGRIIFLHIFIEFSSCRNAIMRIHSQQDECPSVTKAPGFQNSYLMLRSCRKVCCCAQGRTVPDGDKAHSEVPGWSTGAKKLQRQLLLPLFTHVACLPPALRSGGTRSAPVTGCILHICKAASSGCGKPTLERLFQLPGMK